MIMLTAPVTPPSRAIQKFKGMDVQASCDVSGLCETKREAVSMSLRKWVKK